MSEPARRIGAEAMKWVDEHSDIEIALEVARLWQENRELKDAYDRDSEHVMEDEA